MSSCLQVDWRNEDMMDWLDSKIQFLSLLFLAGKYFSALDGTDMNYGGEDNGMGLNMGLGGMAALGNYGDRGQ